jgi:predicted enzyme related to lactoylglutathione lyase
MDVMEHGRMAIATDPVGAQFGLRQGRKRIGCEVVNEIGRIFGLPTAPRSAWTTKFEVADTDATVERTTAAGGTVVDVQDIPYGRIATIHDPFGTVSP